MCPKCGSDDIRPLGKIEADEFFELDRSAFACGACGHEWEET